MSGNSIAAPVLRHSALLLGILLGLVGVHHFATHGFTQVNLDEAALGPQTTATFGKADGKRVHCLYLKHLEGCLQDHAEHGAGRPVTLWLGNSQLHAINQFHPGEETAAPELHRRLFDDGRYLLTASQPNANLQEHYLLFAYLLTKVPVRQLVLPLVFDDLRETGIRPDIGGALDDPDTQALLSRSATGNRLLREHASRDNLGNEVAALEETVQESVETYLSTALADIWPAWDRRNRVRGELFNEAYKTRNRVFGIKASSIRRMIPGRYAANMEALDDILALARSQGVSVALYIAPLRDDVAPPYDIAAYSEFKRNAALIGGVSFHDLEGIVPASLWGAKDSTTGAAEAEIDFMHFQAGGHRIFADAVEAIILELPGGTADR